jgi:cytoskeletal protein CcmA (bactofilin family)
MALKNWRQVKREPESQPQSSALDPVPGTSFIDAGCQLSGKLHFRESVQIDGRIEGQIDADKNVVIGPSGYVHANIKCESIVIAGTVEGDVHARRKITFQKGARVTGQLKAGGIVVDEGAKFKGSIAIGDEEEAKPEPRPAAEAKAAVDLKAAADAAQRKARTAAEPTPVSPRS